jgi:glycosyltransferase involved in cell wall biosynthesis
MRVTYVCADPGVPVFGSKGCSIHVQEIIRAFVQRGDSVEILAARLGGTPPPDLADCRVRFLALDEHTTVAQREVAQQSLAATMARNIDWSHCDLVYERYSLWSDLTQVRAARHGVPSVLEVNAPLIEEQQTHRNLVDRKTASEQTTTAFRHARSIVAVSSEVATYVVGMLRHSSQPRVDKIHVVPNGVDVDRFRPDAVPISQHNGFTVGFVGSLKPWHGVESLLAAFEPIAEAYPSSRLRIIGDGPMRNALQDALNQRSPETARRTEFLGSVAPERIPGYLTSLDAAIAPYMQTDNFYFSPLKVYEYMASGRAVAASATGQLKDLITNGVTGLTFAPGDVVQLTAALVKLAESPALRLRLGRAARQVVLQDHSWETTLDNILSRVIRSVSVICERQGASRPFGR